ncbi:T7SS effector LXG polymorphic toxin [Virgibacillus kimchii]
MGKKVDIAEVSDLSDDLSSAVSDIQSQLDSIKSNIDQINSMDSFSGQAATEAKGYFNDLHKTVLESFSNLFTDLESQLKQHLDSFQSQVDNSASAIVESDYLNENKLDIDDEYENINAERQSINRTLNNVADISSVAAPVFSSVTNDKNEAVETIFDLEEDFSSFSSEGSQGDSQTKDLLHQIEVTINRANTQSGNARFTDYQHTSTSIGLGALRAYSDNSRQEEIENLNDDERAIIAQAEEDYENGKIDWSTLDSIKSGVIATGAQFVKNAVSSKVTGKVADEVAESIVRWAQHNTEHFVNRGLVAAPVNGNNVLFTEPPSNMSHAIRTGARYAPPVVGSAIDFGVQIYQGEDATDAAIKTGGHLAAGAIGAKIGTIAGGPIGTAVGFGIGIAGSMLFDVVYDNRAQIAETLSDVGSGIADGAKKVGEAVSGFFGNLGSAFG